ncbi:MAG: phosphatidate cytidylyltransferase [bacterium]|nr:phosphatidate cytidylyltransferase [bacterium]
MLKRSLTALALLAIAVFVISNGGIPLFIFIWIVTLFSAYELFSMLLRKNKVKLFSGFFLISIFFLSLLPVAAKWIPAAETVFNIWNSQPVKACVVILIVFYITETLIKKLIVPGNESLRFIRAIIFIISTFPYIFLIRMGDNGLINMWFCCFLIWADDVFAFLGGKRFGKRRLSSISPKKTVEGALLGMLGAFACAVVFIFYFKLDLYYMVIAFVVSILAQFGDLHESLTKRFSDVKDSSNFLPGHGGFYDRADSTLFVMPLMFFFFNW